jgi:hypothetical protein
MVRLVAHLTRALAFATETNSELVVNRMGWLDLVLAGPFFINTTLEDTNG